ncbi:sulfurtransferase, partial [Variovorax sp. CT11-76]
MTAGRGAAGRQVDPRRIPGALSYTLKALQQRGLDLSAAAGRDVVLYCNCPNEVSAAQAARVLLARGARRAP